MERGVGKDAARGQGVSSAVGDPSHSAMSRLWQPHSEERRVQPHVLLRMPPSVLLGKLLSYVNLNQLMSIGHVPDATSPIEARPVAAASH